MIVRHRWSEKGACERCGGEKRPGPPESFWRPGEGHWSPYARECTGDRGSPFRVVLVVPNPKNPEGPNRLFQYEGTKENCDRWVRDVERFVAPDGGLGQGARFEVEEVRRGSTGLHGHRAGPDRTGSVRRGRW